MPLINLAELYIQLQRYAEAERFYLRALTILDAALGPDHAEIAFALLSMAEGYRAQRDTTKPRHSSKGPSP